MEILSVPRGTKTFKGDYYGMDYYRINYTRWTTSTRVR